MFAIRSPEDKRLDVRVYGGEAYAETVGEALCQYTGFQISVSLVKQDGTEEPLHEYYPD